MINKFVKSILINQGFILENTFYYYQVESCEESYSKVNEISKEIYETNFMPK